MSGLKSVFRPIPGLGFVPRLQIVKARSEVDMILLLGIVELMASGPVIADSVGKYLPIAGE